MNFIQRYQPALSWAKELDRFFDRNVFNAGPLSAAPRESFHESEDAWILRLDLPGYAKPDVTLTVTDRTLQLKAETPADRPFGGKTEHQWKLGDDVNESAISAKLENGVLELTIPKRPKVEVKPINIEIK
ncbi:MAG: Hsp20/alpha crystallin family protein [Luteolibacter sp.]|uniref:Hsp20/alpha crystallin family protein n=1 Tax=Luteolibacter sp. TaxID=1962973 RepID=UPI003265220C